MFHLRTGRHLLGARGERAEVVLQARAEKLQTELAGCQSLAERQAHSITVLRIGVAALIVALLLTVVIAIWPVKQTISEMIQRMGIARTVNGIDPGEEAYQKGRYAVARKTVQPLAEAGDPRAQRLLGLMYYHGRGLQQNDLEAARWFRRAADQGDAQAQFNLGVLYAEGQGVPQDYVEAIKWYRLAADQGEARAQFNLGVSYAEGQNVEKDNVSAYMWFNLAASRFPSSEAERRRAAINNRDIVARRMSQEQITEAQRLSRDWKPR